MNSKQRRKLARLEGRQRLITELFWLNRMSEVTKANLKKANMFYSQSI